MAISHLQSERSPIEFFKIVKTHPVALDLLISYAKQRDPKMLKELFIFMEQFRDTAQLLISESFKKSVKISVKFR
jgi:hypothetical protein